MNIAKSIKLLKAMADSSRLIILNALMVKPQYVEELSQRLNLAPSTVSFHLKKLEEADLVFKEKEQYYVIFHLNKVIFDSTLNNLISFENIENFLHEDRILKYKERIIKSYFKKGRLTKIPIQFKKRLVILDEICKKFEIDKVYMEKEVNEIISNCHDDYCSIRRYLVDYKFFSRNKGSYKLINVSFDNESQVFHKNRVEKLNSVKHKSVNKIEKNEININNNNNNNMNTKAELKKQYKLTPIPMGIYKIENRINGKILIGSSKNLQGSINKNRFMLKLGNFINPRAKASELQADWNKNGENNFSIEVLDYLKPNDQPSFDYNEELKTLLDLWLDKLQPYGEKGYNKK